MTTHVTCKRGQPGNPSNRDINYQPGSPSVYLEGINQSAARSTPNKLPSVMKGVLGVGTETDNYSCTPQDDLEIL